MHRHGNVSLANLIERTRTTPNPELDPCIPSTTHNNRCSVVREDEARHVLHWLRVLADSDDLVGIVDKVPLPDVVVSASQQDGGSVCLPAETQDWCLDFLRSKRLNVRLRSRLLIVSDPPSVYCAIPSSCHQHLAHLLVRRWTLRAEFQAADRIRWLP